MLEVRLAAARPSRRSVGAHRAAAAKHRPLRSPISSDYSKCRQPRGNEKRRDACHCCSGDYGEGGNY